MGGIGEEDTIRPFFFGVKRRSPVDDNPNEIWYSVFKRRIRTAITIIITAIFLAFACGLTYLVFLLRTNWVEKYSVNSQDPNYERNLDLIVIVTGYL
jgi:hypothetical protein